jgi:hypothetical protein
MTVRSAGKARPRRQFRIALIRPRPAVPAELAGAPDAPIQMAELDDGAPASIDDSPLRRPQGVAKPCLRRARDESEVNQIRLS